MWAPHKTFGLLERPNMDKFEYALINFDTGKMTSRFVMTMFTDDPLLKNDTGSRIPTIEQIRWYYQLVNGPEGPIAMSFEQGMKVVRGRNLATGKKRNYSAEIIQVFPVGKPVMTKKPAMLRRLPVGCLMISKSRMCLSISAKADHPLLRNNLSSEDKYSESTWRMVAKSVSIKLRLVLATCSTAVMI